MLSTLHIENIAVIEQAEISFDSGFNVLTGETGAGKSIVIDAISAILGERASREMIRTGAQKAFVSAIFTGVPELPWFAENQVPYEPELGISREIFADGKNSCRVGGKPVTVSTLRRLGVQLIQIHGQNDSQQLFDEATHIGYLDLFAHDEALLESYRQAYDKVSAVRQEIRRLSMDESEKLRLVETLKFQIDEIERGLAADELHPNKVKRALAKNIVAAYYDEAAAQAAEEQFDLVFKQHAVPDDIPEFAADLTPNDDGTVYLAKLLADASLAASAGEARRLIDGGGVKVNGEALPAKSYNVDPALLAGATLQVGKRKFVKLV